MSSYGTELAVAQPAQLGTLAQRVEYAAKLSQAGLLPVAYRRNPPNVLVAIETGDMLGIATMAAISNIHVIEGKPTFSAGLMAALVRRSGHKVRITGDDNKAVATILRHDDPDFEFRSEWTLDRAVQADLVALRNGKPFARDSKGNPKPWERYPAAMLKARAIAEVCRDACQDVFLGPVYVPEEMGAVVDEDGMPLDATYAMDTTPESTGYTQQPSGQEPVDAEYADEPPTPEAQQPAQQQRVQEPSFTEVDWDTALRTADGDVEALTELVRAANIARAGQDVVGRIVEATLYAAGDDAKALRTLWDAGRQAGAPQELIDRVIAAGKAATGADAPAPGDDTTADGESGESDSGETATTSEPSDNPADHDTTDTGNTDSDSAGGES